MSLSNMMLASAEQALTAEELRGRKIYRDGDDGTKNEIIVTLGLSSDRVSASTFACTNCHGLEGEGKQEGGLNVPIISSQHLFTANFSTSSQDQAYNAKTLMRAITQGIDAQNKPLSAAMPRYALTHNQAQALVAYLKRLGSANDFDAGITATEVQLATLLPLTGPEAVTGKSLQATLEACVAELNSQGALYGRKLTLTTLNSGSTTQEVLASTRRLIAETKPFALIAGYFPEITEEINKLLAQERLPIIAPLTFAPNETSIPATTFFYFLPSYVEQSLALIDYWHEHILKEDHASESKLAIVYSDSANNANVVRQIRGHIHRHHLQAMTEVVMPQSIKKYDLYSITNLIKVKPDAIFFLGDFKELAKFNKLIAKIDHQPMLLGLFAMLGAEVINIPDLIMTKMLLASPFVPSNTELQQFAAVLDRYSVNLQNPGLQKIACSAVNFVGEGLKHTGKHLSRSLFIKSLKQINNFPLGIMPSLNFGSNSRQGLKGAYILTVNIKSGTTTLSEWVSPVN